MREVETVVNDRNDNVGAAGVAKAVPGVHYFGVSAFFEFIIDILYEAVVFQVPLVRQQVVEWRRKSIFVQRRIEIGFGGFYQRYFLQTLRHFQRVGRLRRYAGDDRARFALRHQQQVEFIQHHLLFVRAYAVLKHDIDVAGGHHGAVAAFGVINVRAYFHFIAFAHFIELLLIGAVAFVERHNLKTAEVFQQLRFNVVGLLQIAGSGRFQSYPLFAFPEGDVAFSTFDDQLAHSGVRLYVCAYRSLRKRKLGIFWEWQRMRGRFLCISSQGITGCPPREVVISYKCDSSGCCASSGRFVRSTSSSTTFLQTKHKGHLLRFL